MARKKKHEEHENLERWLVSYADFITLLFAFFVVMYSISSVNEGKYRVLSDSITKAFSGQTGTKPIKLGDPVKSPISTIVNSDAVAAKPSNHDYRAEQDAAAAQVAAEQQAQEMNKMASALDQELKSLIDKGLISVNRESNWIEVEINTSILFSSGSAELERAALPVLGKVSQTLIDSKFNIQVEGFTDNIPISTEFYPSNWELSAARAASVVRTFTESGVSPKRMVALGFAEYRPVADNNTEAGRSKNRRVTVVILPPGQSTREAASQSRLFDSSPPPETAVPAPSVSPPEGVETPLPPPTGGAPAFVRP